MLENWGIKAVYTGINLNDNLSSAVFTILLLVKLENICYYIIYRKINTLLFKKTFIEI